MTQLLCERYNSVEENKKALRREFQRAIQEMENRSRFTEEADLETKKSGNWRIYYKKEKITDFNN